MREGEDLTTELEELIKIFLKPVQGIPFHIAIQTLTGKMVYKLNKSDDKDKKLIEKLSKAADIAVKNANHIGIYRNRPNEVGNDMEPYVKDALKEIGLQPETPKRSDGVRQSTGYPDIYFKDDFNRHIYLECKTYNKGNISTTLRAFYLSPPISGKSKIIYDALHIVLSFEIEQITRDNRRCYIPVAWKLVDIYNMKLDVKHEFNAHNIEMYGHDAIITEGKID